MSTSKYRQARRSKYHLMAASVNSMLELYNTDQNAAIRMGYELFGESFKNALLRHIYNFSIDTSFKLAAARCLQRKFAEWKEQDRG